MNDFLRQAFAHAEWATRTLLRTCGSLSGDELRRPRRGIGSILATFDHLIRADAGYAACCGAPRPAWAGAAGATSDAAELERRAGENAERWAELVSGPLDLERRLLLDGGDYECSVTVVLLQALHHGAVHREQIRAAIAEAGVPPPDVQAWEWALRSGVARGFTGGERASE